MLVKFFFTPRIILFVILFAFLSFTGSTYAGRSLITIETNLGDITVELFQDETPKTVENFLGYVDSGFYEGLIFHRVSTSNSVIQTGAYDPNIYDVDFSPYTKLDPYNIHDPNAYHEPGDPIELEAGLSNVRGTIGMARTSNPDSATSQFYINFNDNPGFNPGNGSEGYAVFGKVIEGMDIVDQISVAETIEDPDGNVNTEEYDHITAYFPEIPQTPITVNRISRIQDFVDDTSSNFNNVDFLNVADGGIRTFVGAGGNQGDIWSYEFNEEQYLGIKCLKWHHNAQDTSIPDKTYYMARDSDGDIFILKELKDEGSNSEQTLYEADDMMDIRSISYYADLDMYFRLIAGSYDSSVLNSDDNKIVLGSGGSTETEKIIDFDASLAPNYTNDDVIIVKYSRGLEGSETLIEYYYYHKDEGLILYLQDENQDLTGDAWWLDQKIFDSESVDFSEVPFLKLENDFAFTRYFVSKGDRDQNFSTSISYPTDQFNGVNYIKWIQNGITEEGIRNFELHLAKDTNDIVWVFYYENDFQVIFEANTLIEAVKLETFANENIHFALISDAYNPDDINDSDNKISRVENTITVNEKIVAFNETLSHIPHYQNELVKVKRWEGDDADEDDNNIWYYHQDVGLVRNYRDGETDSDGNGWEVAHFGGLFKTDSADFSNIDFIKAAAGNVKHYYGSKDLEDENYTYEFTSLSFGGIKALKLISSPDNSNNKDFEIQLGRDSLDTVWVFRYRIDGDNVFYAGSSSTAYLYAKPLSYFTDDNMYFKLIAGEYDSALPYDPDNTDTEVNKIAYTLNSEQITEQIVSFNASLSDVPYYNDDLILVEYNNATDPNDSIRWKYYHPDDGLVREVYGQTNEPADFENITTYRLAWAGKAKPTFNNDSDDFSEIDYLYAKPGDIKLMNGQGYYDGKNYLIEFKRSKVLDTICLEISSDLTHIEDINTKESYYFTRDPDLESLWILAHYVNDQPVFATNYLDQAVPFERWPDLRWQLCAESKEIGNSVSYNNFTKKLIAEEVEIPQRDDLNNQLTVLKHTYDLEADPDLAVTGYTYLDLGEGVVLSLLDSFTDPNAVDPNFDDPDDIEVEVADGFFQAKETGLDELEISVKTSKNRNTGKISDKFVLTGEFDLTDAEFLGNPITFVVGTWSTTIDTDSPSFKEVADQRYRYSGTAGSKGKISLYLDLRDTKDTFTLKAAGIDLSGLAQPIEITMIAGNELYQNTAALVGDMPVYQLHNTFDSLQAYKYTRRWTDKRKNDKLIITGGITSKNTIDLTNIDELTISWGSSASQTLSDSDFKQSGNKNRYYLRKPDSPLQKLIIDWDNSYFKAYFMKNSLAAPSQALKITITDTDGNTIFDQTTTVK